MAEIAAVKPIRLQVTRSSTGAAIAADDEAPVSVDAAFESRLIAAPSQGRDHRAALRSLAGVMRRGPAPLQQLAHRIASSHAPGETTSVAVTLDDAATARWPWESMPAALLIGDVGVVRRTSATRDPPTSKARGVLVADAVGDVAAASAGSAIANAYENKGVQIRRVTSVADVVDAVNESGAATLHLICSGRTSPDAPGFSFAFDPPASADDVGAALATCDSLRLVVLDAGGAGSVAGLAIATALAQTVVLGFVGSVHAAKAVDTLTLVHRRLQAGDSTLEAVMAAAPSTTSDGLAHWNEPFVLSGHSGVVTRGPGDRSKASRTPTIEVEFTPVEAICPALLINDRPAVERLRIHRAGRKGDLEIEVQCDTGTGVSVSRAMMPADVEMFHLDGEALNFPVLYELIGRGVQRRKVNFTLRVRDGDTIVHQQTRPIRYLGPTEWLDEPQTWPYIPSYVLPESEGVKVLLGRAQSAAADNVFSGPANTPEQVDAQMAAIYEAVRDLKLTYVNPPAAPVYVETGSEAAGQRVRFPDDVVRHLRATCHDLSLLIAACGEHYGLRPLVVMFVGHTFMGYWRSSQDHDAFWSARREDIGRRVTTHGDDWSITSTDLLIELIEKEQVQLIETTDAPRNRPFEEACSRARDHLLLRGWTIDVAIDVWSARRKIEPLFTPRAFEEVGPSDRLIAALASRLEDPSR